MTLTGRPRPAERCHQRRAPAVGRRRSRVPAPRRRGARRVRARVSRAAGCSSPATSRRDSSWSSPVSSTAGRRGCRFSTSPAARRFATSRWPSGPASSCRAPRPKSWPAGASTRFASQPTIAAPLVVDLCTGSGVIALAIAQEVRGATVHAVEREAAAYEWAERNATGHRRHRPPRRRRARAARARRHRRPRRRQPALPARRASRSRRPRGSRPRSGRRAMGRR